MSSKYAVDVPSPPSPSLLPLITGPDPLDVNDFYLEQLRTPADQLDAFNARQAREAARTRLSNVIPHMCTIFIKLGVVQRGCSCYLALVACNSIFGSALMATFWAICFNEFGVPLPFAIAFGFAFSVTGLFTWLNFRDGYRKGQFALVYILPFGKELEAAYKKHQGLSTILPCLFWTVSLSTLA